MFFSIIIPVFNVEKYLTECIDSLICQSFSSFEIILIDDGSEDNSASICDDFAQKDNRIKVIHKKNGGQSSARNVGTQIATGEYIIYIDSDDYIIDCDFLKKIHDCADGKDIIFYKHKKYYDERKVLCDCTYSYCFGEEQIDYVQSLLQMIRADAFFGMPWNKSIRRKVIVDNNISFQEGLTGEDMDWIYYVILNSQSLATIDEAFVAYRQRKNSVTSSIKIKNLDDYVSILEKWSCTARNREYSDDVKKVMEASLAKYYSNLLIMYSRISDRKKHDYDYRIKALSYLLKKGISKRPIYISKLYSICGFRMTVLLLSMADKL